MRDPGGGFIRPPQSLEDDRRERLEEKVDVLFCMGIRVVLKMEELQPVGGAENVVWDAEPSGIIASLGHCLEVRCLLWWTGVLSTRSPSRGMHHRCASPMTARCIRALP